MMHANIALYKACRAFQDAKSKLNEHGTKADVAVMLCFFFLGRSGIHGLLRLKFKPFQLLSPDSGTTKLFKVATF